MRGLYTQMIGTVGGMNVIIDSNQMLNVQPVAGGSSAAVIDIEPNTQEFGSENLQITNNIIDARLAQSSANGIVVQRGYGANLRNVRVEGNILIGANSNQVIFQDNDVSISNDEITQYGHGFLTGQQIYLTTYGGNGSLPVPLKGDLFWVIRTGVDTFKLANSFVNANAGNSIDIRGTGFNSYIAVSRKGLTNGITFDNCDGCVASNNTITGAGQLCIDAYTTNNLVISENTLNLCGGGGNDAILLSSTVNSIVRNNIINLDLLNISGSRQIVENFKTILVDTTSGSPIVQGSSGYYHPYWFQGKTITINAIDYTIKDVEGDKLILTKNAVSTLSQTRATLKFSNNKYLANFSSGVTMVNGGTSIVISNY
jgi:hypothetical protein